VIRLWPPAGVALLALLLVPAAGARGTGPSFTATVERVGPKLAAAMTGVSWHPGCPVPISALRLVTLRYYGFDGRVHTGHLVVNEDATAAITGAFGRLYAARFPIRRMQLVDRYGGSDFASIQADNTSAFNCRPVSGSSSWSEHAYGRAIDVNPIENPYVYASSGSTSHKASIPYLDRSDHRPGMAYESGVLVAAFDAVHWGWGGRWSGDKDYQHFSATGT
jgi:hypothetical protein